MVIRRLRRWYDQHFRIKFHERGVAFNAWFGDGEFCVQFFVDLPSRRIDWRIDY